RGPELLAYGLSNGVAQWKQEGRHRRVVAQAFVALAVGRPNVHDLDRSIPVGRGRHRPMVGPEADKIGVFSVRRAAKTADVVLSTSGHLGGRRVPDVRVMLPDHDS